MSDEEFAGWVREQVKWSRGGFRFMRALARRPRTCRSRPIAWWGRFVAPRRRRRLFVFNFDHATAVSIVPGIGLGVGRTPAVPPHRKKMEEGKEQGAE